MNFSDLNTQTPEEQISYIRNFIRELTKVQESYFNNLIESLNLTEEGEICLFDYIHNSEDEDKYITFEEYMDFYGKKRSDLFVNV